MAEKCKSCFKEASSTSRAGLCKECVTALAEFGAEVAAPLPEPTFPCSTCSNGKASSIESPCPRCGSSAPYKPKFNNPKVSPLPEIGSEARPLTEEEKAGLKPFIETRKADIALHYGSYQETKMALKSQIEICNDLRERLRQTENKLVALQSVPSPVPLGEGASEAEEVWLVEFRSDVYPEWTPWHFEFYQSEEDADSEVQELRQGKAGLAHSRSEFRATRYTSLASKAVPITNEEK